MDAVIGRAQFRRADFLSLDLIADAEEGRQRVVARQVSLANRL